jgi:hypothetical protein
MAKIKVDASGVDAGGFGPPLDDGTHRLKLVQATHRKKNANGDAVNDLETVWEKDAQHGRIWEYIPLNKDASNSFRLAQFLDALGLPRKAEFDPKAQEGKFITARTVIESRDGYDPRARIRNMFKPVDEDGAEPSEDGDEPAAGGGEGPYGRSEMETWEDSDLKEYAEELGVDVPKGRGWKTKLLDELVAAESEGEDPEADEPEAEAGGSPLLEGIEQDFITELSADDSAYADWTDEDVDWMIDGLGIGGNVSGRKTKANKIKAIVAFAEEALGGGDGGGEPDQYDDEEIWSNEDLLAEINSRIDQGTEIEITGRKTRAKMIEALRKDDEPF